MTLPVALVIVVFAVANRQVVTVDLWPFELSLTPPLFALVLGAMLIGFLAGMFVMWVSAGKTRDRARRQTYRASSLEREVSYLKRKQADATEKPSAHPPAPPQPVTQVPAVPSRG